MNSKQSKALLATRLRELELLAADMSPANRSTSGVEGLQVSGPAENLVLRAPDFADTVLRGVIVGAIDWDRRLSRDGMTVVRFGTDRAAKELLALPGPGQPLEASRFDGVTEWAQVYNAVEDEEGGQPVVQLRPAEKRKQIRCCPRLSLRVDTPIPASA